MTDDATISQHIEFELGAMQAPVTDLRKQILRKHLRVIDGKVQVVDEESGEVRYRGRNPMTLRELVVELIYWRTPEGRLLAWRPYGKPL